MIFDRFLPCPEIVTNFDLKKPKFWLFKTNILTKNNQIDKIWQKITLKPKFWLVKTEILIDRDLKKLNIWQFWL